MALSVGEIAVHIRAAADAASVPAEISLVIGAMKAWADLAIERAAPNAPEQYKDMALILLAGYVYDRPNAPRGSQYSNALLNSGAANILKPFLRRTALILDDSGGSDEVATISGISNIQYEEDDPARPGTLVITTSDGRTIRLPQMRFLSDL